MNGPFRIRVPEPVRSDAPFASRVLSAGDHVAECDDYGAVFSAADDGRAIGLKPGEFEYLSYPPAGVPLAMTPKQVRQLADRVVNLEACLDRLERAARCRDLSAGCPHALLNSKAELAAAARDAREALDAHR